MEKKNKKASFLSNVFKFAGQKKSSYIISIILAIAGVACEMIPFFLIGAMVKMLIEGVGDFGAYLPYSILIGAFWVGRVFFIPFQPDFHTKPPSACLVIYERKCVTSWPRHL